MKVGTEMQLTQQSKEGFKFPAFDKWVYENRESLIHNLIPILSLLYGLSLYIDPHPSLTDSIDVATNGAFPGALAAGMFVMAGAFRLGRAVGTVPLVLHAVSLFPWLLMVFLAVWAALVDFATPAVIVVYGGLFVFDFIYFVTLLYEGTGNDRA